MMAWSRLLCADRLGETHRPQNKLDHRTPFEKDVDRVIFSGSFRRLAHKTQVHPLSGNDHVHTRLTHSLEVAKVGRTLGYNVGKKIAKELPENYSPDDLGTIMEAACLAHDIGTPPFGHPGEDAIVTWLKSYGSDLPDSFSEIHKNDVSSFEGNAQGFRMITQTDNHIWEGGLQLTFATLGAYMKYPWDCSNKDNNGKFGVYQTEILILDKVADKVGLIKLGDHKYCRHPLAYLCEAADDICYATIDLEDAVELEMIKFEQAFEILVSILGGRAKNRISKKIEAIDEKSYRCRLNLLRGPVFDILVDRITKAFLKHKKDILKGEFQGSLLESLPKGDTVRVAINRAIDLGKDSFYKARKRAGFDLGCYATIETLLDAFCRASMNYSNNLLSDPGVTKPLTPKEEVIMNLFGNHKPMNGIPKNIIWDRYQCFRRALDYISGMTDRYAIALSEQIQGTHLKESLWG